MTAQSPVPDFFQEETTDALRRQVDWLVRELGLDAEFFVKLVGTDVDTFSAWRACEAELPPDGENTLRHLWQMTLHLLSFLNFDGPRVRNLFSQTIPADREGVISALRPPWSGSSLRGYLEQAGEAGLDKVERWVTGMRFGDPYAA